MCINVNKYVYKYVYKCVYVYRCILYNDGL